jgi:hypothetical protein
VWLRYAYIIFVGERNYYGVARYEADIDSSQAGDKIIWHFVIYVTR